MTIYKRYRKHPYGAVEDGHDQTAAPGDRLVETIRNFRSELIKKFGIPKIYSIDCATLRLIGIADLCAGGSCKTDTARVIKLLDKDRYTSDTIDLLSSSLLMLAKRSNGEISRWLDILEKGDPETRFSVIITIGKCTANYCTDIERTYKELEGIGGSVVSAASTRRVILANWARGTSAPPPILQPPRVFRNLSREEQNKVNDMGFFTIHRMQKNRRLVREENPPLRQKQGNEIHDF